MNRSFADSSPAVTSIYTDEPPAATLNLTFISIHDLTNDARILYSSESIIDVLGYTPAEICGRSLWEFFSPDEIPFAKQYHKRGVEMDKAAMLAYCKVLAKDGQWIGCECCFTIVYDVMVVCTTIYRSGIKSLKRAREAPIVRRMFTSSPKDPRYHMLTHISRKFQQPARTELHEPRAALFLNRFTRSLYVMYATSAVSQILGIDSETIRGQSFYDCISEACHADATRCIEGAKGNDSVAYLRFIYRDPRLAGPPGMPPRQSSMDQDQYDSDEEMTEIGSEEYGSSMASTNSYNTSSGMNQNDNESSYVQPQSRTSSNDSTNPNDTSRAIFGDTPATNSTNSTNSSAPQSPSNSRHRRYSDHQQTIPQHLEIEAVISCTSDGLVVCIRRAHVIPQSPITSTSPLNSTIPPTGLYAAPWAEEPLIPPIIPRTTGHPHVPSFSSPTPFLPVTSPNSRHVKSNSIASPRDRGKAADRHDFMHAIMDQAIFAWALTGINGSMHRFGKGKACGESVPVGGLPIWKSDRLGQFNEDGRDDGFHFNNNSNNNNINSYYNDNNDNGIDGYNNGVYDDIVVRDEVDKMRNVNYNKGRPERVDSGSDGINSSSFRNY